MALRSALVALVLLTLVAAGRASTRELYAKANALYSKANYSEALDAFIEAAASAEVEGLPSYRFSAGYNASFSAHHLVRNEEAIRHAEGALAVAASNRTSAWAARRESGVNEIELIGIIERSNYTAARLAEGQRQHRRAVARYRETFHLRPGDKPLAADEVKDLPDDARSLGWRLIEREAAYLHDVGHTAPARAMLRAAIDGAEGDLVSPPKHRISSFYACKLLRTLANIEGFVGYEQHAYDLASREWELGKTWKKRNELFALNMTRLAALADLNGATDDLIKEADQVLEQAGEAKVRDLAGLKRVHASIAARALTPEQRAAQLLAAADESKAKGDDHEHFFSSRDLLFEHASQNRAGLDNRFHAFLLQTRQQGNLRAEPRIYRRYADWLVLQRRLGDAIRTYRQALQLTMRYQWHPMVPTLYAKLGAAYLADGQSEKAEEVWAEIARYAVLHPDIPAKAILDAREIQLAALIKDGRAEEAVAFARAWHRYGVERRVAEYWLAPFIPEHIRAVAPSPLASDEGLAARNVVLHPTAITTVAVTGQLAEAMFYLLNPDAKTAAGKIMLEGPGLTATEEDTEHLGFVFEEDAPARRVELPLTLAGGDFLKIRLRMMPASGKPMTPDAAATIQLTWTASAGSHTAVASWRYSWDGAALNASVLDSAEAGLNPFIGMPVQHTIHVPAGETEPVAFRVRANRPLRIEYVDARKGTLLAVDNNGNGDLTEAGDLCVTAKAGSVAPTPVLTPLAGASNAEIEVWYFPTIDTPLGSEITLGVELYQDKEWSPHATDRLKF